MPGIVPRDMQQWMRTMERGMRQANGAASSIALSVVGQEIGKYADAVEEAKDRQPAPPIELTAQTYIALTPGTAGRPRVYQSGVNIDFPDLTIGMDALPLEISSYELWGRTGTDPFARIAVSDISSIQWFGAVPGSVWEFKVRGIGTYTTKPGVFSAVLTVTMTVDTTAPGQPSTPTATGRGKAVTIKWDGKIAGGASMPLDLDYVIVAAGTAASPTTEVYRFQPGEIALWVDTEVEYNVTKFYRLRAVDTSGNMSPWSTQASAYGTPLVDVDIILSHLDGAKITLGTVAGEALADQAVTAVKLKDGAVDQAKLASAINAAIAQGTSAYGSIPAMNTAIATADGKAVLAQQTVDAAKLNYDAKIAQIIAQGISLVRNGDFEAANLGDGWGSGAFNAVESTTARSGTKSMRIGPNPGGNVWPISEYVPAATGRTYYLEGWFKRTGTEVKALGVGFVVQAKTAAGGTSTPIVGKVDSATISETVWTKVSTTYTVTTADTVAVRFAPWIVAGNNVYNVDDMLVIDITEAEAARVAVVAAQADATKAITDAATALTSANGKNTFTDSVVDAALAIPGKTIGDGWRKWTTLASGGKLLKSWRWSGSAWIADAMDPTYLPLVDIGAGTFGSLNGNRMQAGTIEVQHLAVGDFTNLIPGAGLSAGTTGWTISGGTHAVVTTSTGMLGLKLTKANGTGEVTDYAPWVDVIPGKQVRLSYAVEGSWDVGNGAIYAQKKTADGTISSFSPGVTNAGSPGRPDHSYVVTIPSDAVQVRFRPYISAGSAAGSTATFSNMMARWMNNGELTVDGTVTANAIATNAVQAKHIIIGDFANLAIGADFEDAAQVPFNLHANHTITTAQKKYGTSSLRLAPTAGGIQKSLFTNDVTTKEGEQWYVKMWAYIDATFNGTATNNKLRFGTQTGAFVAELLLPGIPRSAWKLIEATVTVPAGCTKLTPEIWNDHTAGYAYIDDIQIRRMSEASLIQNLGVEKLIATAASIDAAVIDKLWTEVINSRKITTDMLVVTSGTNLIPDAGFQAPESRAKKYGNALGWDTYVSGVGKQAIRYGQQDPVWPAVGYLNLLDYDSTPSVADKSGWLPVIGGEKYEFSGSLYANDASISTKIYVTYALTDGTTSGYSTPTIYPNTANAANQRPVWEWTVPATAIKMGVRIEHRGTAGWVSLYNDGVYLRKKVDATLIATGGVLTDHLTVEDTMWAKIIKFKKLTGGEIDVNSLTSDTAWIGVLRGGVLINDSVDTGVLKATAITSKHTITGAKFQTVTTANRGIKFDVNGLKMWDATGVQTMDLNASTGYATVTGRVRTAPDGQPGVVLIPPVESDDGKTMALWFTPDTSILAGGVTAGMWISNPATASTPGQVSIRGQQYGGLRLWDAVEFISSNGATVPQFYSNSNVGLQATAYNGHLYLTSGAAETRIKSVFNTSINVGTGKTLNLQVNSSPYSATNGSSANAIIFTDGNVFKVSSALKYKIDPVPMAVPDSLLDDVTVKHWIDLGMAERFAASFDVMGPLDEQAQREYDALSLQRIPGAIAEDVVAAGGEQFATRDLEGELDGLMYDRFALARTEVLKRRAAEQAAEIAELRTMLGALAEKVTALERL